MQLALTPGTLIAVGAVALVLGLGVLLVRRRRRRARPAVAVQRPEVSAAPRGGPGQEPAPVGSGRTVAAAVAQALATREARGLGGPPPGGRGDARDTLLSVLLDDPVRAAGAAVDLESCRRQLDRLVGALDHERGHAA